ncbi:MAG: glycogen/starch synthase [Ignavibacteria bacterium]|nr:glycogen/starch synthase [Ignavibacteria bacterium]MBI3766778.1 glycogen/starch synthase [Ignavibacteriales bacterium]
MNHVIMLASENDALKGGKVGGVGDVVRDLPTALAHLGWRTTIITPSYGFLHKQNPSERYCQITFPFGGKEVKGEFWKVRPKSTCESVTHLVFEHREIRGEPIYFNDPPNHPFAQDSTKYAIFCSAVGQYLNQIPQPFVVHLHDWHAATYFLLRELHPAFAHLKSFKSVFTIHNLAIQGTRPMRGSYASVESWFPELFLDKGWISEWKDPRYNEPTFTPMTAGVRYATKVHTVSPTYAEEILKPSDRHNGLYLGEGLEGELQGAKKERRLYGILNGIEYPAGRNVPRMSFQELCELILREIKPQIKQPGNQFFNELTDRVEKLKDSQPSCILTSVTRIVEQKVKLLFEPGSRERSAMDELLQTLKTVNGVYIVLGTGTPDYEEKLEQCFQHHDRFLFIKAYSEPLSAALFANGTMFMMPSSFEPCGIGQMVAMRDGQPCIVNTVGGLKDTVIDNVNGFRFSGATLMDQVDNLIAVTRRAITIFLEDKPQWERVSKEAARARFTWESSAKQYIDLLYS